MNWHYLIHWNCSCLKCFMLKLTYSLNSIDYSFGIFWVRYFIFLILLEIVLLKYFACASVSNYLFVMRGMLLLTNSLFFIMSTLYYNDEHMILYISSIFSNLLNIQGLPNILDVVVFTIAAKVSLKLLKV